jgi:hypothetical protein
MDKRIINVRYIQRLSPPNGKLNPYSFGGGIYNGGLSDQVMENISQFASFEYMGAAEYEMDRLPNALSKMYENNSKDSLTIKKVKVLSHDIWILANKSLLTEVHSIVKKLGTTKKMERSLKASSLFPAILKNRIQDSSTQGWIDIENGYMFFISENMAQGFLKLLNS